MAARQPARPATFHSHFGRANHWTGDPCPVELRAPAGYTCPGTGLVHDSEIRSWFYSLVDERGRRVGLTRLDALARELDRGWLGTACLEHETAYVSRDEWPRSGSDRGRPVLKIRGCRHYLAFLDRIVRDVAAGRSWRIARS